MAVRPWRLPMAARDTAEKERAATPFELFFDLSFVVAVAQASIARACDLSVWYRASNG